MKERIEYHRKGGWRRCGVVLSLLALLLMVSCRNDKSGTQPADAAGASAGQTLAESYPMPAIPDSIQTPEGRASYVACHYWDAFPFGDHPDTTYVEQAFVDYVSVLPVADGNSRDRGVAGLLARMDGPQLKYLMDLADHYLGNPESPVRSDDVYLAFLKAYVDLPAVDDAEKTRPRFLIDNLQKNRVGDVATDFAYYDVQARRQRTLHSTEGRFLVVYFHDPDCEHCQEEMPVAFTMASLRHSDVRVLLMNTESEQGVGQVSGQPLPDNWIDGYDPGQAVAQRQLYYLPAKPSLYLLDAQKRILLKDASLQAIDDYLSQSTE